MLIWSRNTSSELWEWWNRCILVTVFGKQVFLSNNTFEILFVILQFYLFFAGATGRESVASELDFLSDILDSPTDKLDGQFTEVFTDLTDFLLQVNYNTEFTDFSIGYQLAIFQNVYNRYYGNIFCDSYFFIFCCMIPFIYNKVSNPKQFCKWCRKTSCKS